jgi:predicted N-acetyltransferase YhbS
MEIKNPTSAELTDLISLISKAFLYKEEEGDVARDFPQLYDANNSKHLWVAKEKESLLAHAGFYPTEMKIEGIALPVAGIGGVFSVPEVRGQGLGSQLVEKCLEEAKKSGSALAFLWSDKHDYYAKMGFHLVGRQWTLHFLPEHEKTLRAQGEKSGLKTQHLRFSLGEISPEFLQQSFQLQENLPVGIARSFEEHQKLLSSGACDLFAAWAGRQLIAYFVMGKGKDLQNYVHEWAGDEAALHHLAAHCLENFQHGFYLLSPQFMPDEVNWLYTLDQLGVSMRAERMGLVKILNFSKIQRLVSEYLSRLGLNPEELHLSQNGEKYLVKWRENTNLEFSEENFLKFLFGPEMPTHQELKAFLPIRLWYWGMDSV